MRVRHLLAGFAALAALHAHATYFDGEAGALDNGYRTLAPAQGRYLQADPAGMRGGPNVFIYVSANPLRFIDPLGLTQTDIDNALAAAKSIMPSAKYPSTVTTWSQDGKAGKSTLFSESISVDAKYLACLNDGQASALLMTILHEIAHFNQSWYEFGVDNLRERMTGGNSSDAQSAAEVAAFNNSALVAQYLRNRSTGKSTCQCRQ